MGTSELLRPFLALLAGGALASLGPGLLARRGAIKTRLVAARGRAVAAYGVVSLLIAAGAVWWFFVRLRAAVATDPSDIGSSLGYFAFGLAVGLPLSVPAVFSAWNTFRKESRAERRRRARAATPEERLEYAQGLAGQIREVSPDRAGLEARLGGEKQNILVFEGPLERSEGDRLVAAFRNELRGLGFQRVEGSGTSGDWWSRV